MSMLKSQGSKNEFFVSYHTDHMCRTGLPVACILRSYPHHIFIGGCQSTKFSILSFVSFVLFFLLLCLLFLHRVFNALSSRAEQAVKKVIFVFLSYYLFWFSLLPSPNSLYLFFWCLDIATMSVTSFLLTWIIKRSYWVLLLSPTFLMIHLMMNLLMRNLIIPLPSFWRQQHTPFSRTAATFFALPLIYQILDAADNVMTYPTR